MTCCFFSSLKTLLTLTEGIALASNQCPERCLSLAGFQVIIYGRFWVFTEGERRSKVAVSSEWFQQRTFLSVPR